MIDHYKVITLSQPLGLSFRKLKSAAREGETVPVKKERFSKIRKSFGERIAKKSTGTRAFSAGKIDLIRSFWLSPAISKVSPYETHVVSRKSKRNPETIHEPLFNRQVTIKEAFKRFTIEYPDVKCSRTSFFDHKPANVKRGQSQQDCCPICAESCREMPKLESRHASALSSEERSAMESYEFHKTHHAQRVQDFKGKLDLLKDHEAIFIIDFKSNISLGKCQVEESQIFFNAPQRTLFGVVIYVRLNGETFRINITVVTPILSHDSRNVDRILREVLDDPTVKSFELTSISFWMDNAPNHFRTKEFLGTMFSLSGDLVITIDYFAEYHGKSACDQHFGHISQIYKNHCRQPNQPINTSADFLEMYCDAIVNNGGRLILPGTIPHSRISKLWNVIAIEIPALEFVSAAKAEGNGDRSGVKILSPYSRVSLKETRSGFIFSNFYHFSFITRPSGTFLACSLDGAVRRRVYKYKFSITKTWMPKHQVKMGAATALRPRFASLTRLKTRAEFHFR